MIKIRSIPILLPLLISSCKNMYVPSIPNVPMFEKKNELNATLRFSNYQLAYAITDHIGLTLNGQLRGNRIIIAPYSGTGSHTNFDNKNKGIDMAMCYYKVDPKTINEILVGYGQGFTSFSYSDNPGGPSGPGPGGSAHFRKFYFQWDVVWKGRKETTKWALTTKLDIVGLYDFRDTQDHYMENCASLIFSPGLTWRKKIEDGYLLTSIHVPLPTAVDKEKLSPQYGEYPPFYPRVMASLAFVIPIINPHRKEVTR